jgi:hypothetical protein
MAAFAAAAAAAQVMAGPATAVLVAEVVCASFGVLAAAIQTTQHKFKGLVWTTILKLAVVGRRLVFQSRPKI